MSEELNDYEHVRNGIIDALGDSLYEDDIDEAELVVRNVQRVVAERDELQVALTEVERIVREYDEHRLDWDDAREMLRGPAPSGEHP